MIASREDADALSTSVRERTEGRFGGTLPKRMLVVPLPVMICIIPASDYFREISGFAGKL